LLARIYKLNRNNANAAASQSKISIMRQLNFLFPMFSKFSKTKIIKIKENLLAAIKEEVLFSILSFHLK
jgi:hypothetical protein